MALLVTESRKAAYAGAPLSGHWLRGVDLNHRPLGYEPNELPDCSTPQSEYITSSGWAKAQSARRGAGICGRLALHLLALAGFHHLGGINCLIIHLLLGDFS